MTELNREEMDRLMRKLWVFASRWGALRGISPDDREEIVQSALIWAISASGDPRVSRRDLSGLAYQYLIHAGNSLPSRAAALRVDESPGPAVWPIAALMRRWLCGPQADLAADLLGGLRERLAETRGRPMAQACFVARHLAELVIALAMPERWGDPDRVRRLSAAVKAAVSLVVSTLVLTAVAGQLTLWMAAATIAGSVVFGGVTYAWHWAMDTWVRAPRK